MTDGNLKLLRRHRKWRSELIEKGHWSDWEMLRTSQRWTVQLVWMAFFQAVIQYNLSGSHRFYQPWLSLVFAAGAFWGIWRWWRIEQCWSELEDDLVVKLSSFQEGD